MIIKLTRLIIAWCGLLLFSGTMMTAAMAYDYPFDDRYAATVIGTPREYAEVLPGKIPLYERKITIFPDRKIPGVLWNLDKLAYSYVAQEGPAPLIFMIAGTGSSYKSSKMRMMQRAYYSAGFHVISISSPTHPNFIVAASASGVPGHLEEDSQDIYNAMQAIWARHREHIQATKFYLTGYSLGATQSAFVAKLDETEKAFNFDKVLMINPPVSLYSSVQILDRLLAENIPGGIENFGEFYQKVVDTFGEVYAHGDHVEFNDEFLYEAYKYKKPQTDAPLKALIGISFRISCENMAFVSDVLTKAGYVVPKGLRLGRHDHITPYLKVLSRLTFTDYFEGIFLPHFQGQDGSVTEAGMIETMSLKSIEDYLRNTKKIGLIHNQDDIIMAEGEVDYLRGLFGSRATIYPHGGHCGNIAYPDNVAAMIAFFSTK